MKDPDLAWLGAIIMGVGRKDQTLAQVDKGLSDLHGISKDLVNNRCLFRRW